MRRRAFALMFFLLFCLVRGNIFAPALLGAQDANFEELVKSASAARDSGKREEATSLYRRAVAVKPEWVEGWWYLGTMAYDADKYNEAIPAFQRVVALAPQFASAWTFLGLCEFQQKDYDNSLEHLDKGRALGDQDDPALLRVAHFHIALLKIRAQKFSEAADLLSKDFSQAKMPDQAQFALGLALLRAPLLPGEVAPSKEGLIQDAGRLAADALARGDKKLVTAFPSVLAAYPHNPYLYYAYGQTLLENGQAEEAARMFQKELEITPSSALAKFAVEGTADSSAAAEELRDYYRDRAAPADASSTQGLWNQALQDFRGQKFQEAIEKLDSFVRAQPGFGPGWAVMGLSEFRLKQFDNARVHLQKGQDLGIGSDSEAIRMARYALAVLQIRSGEFERATGLLVPQAGEGALAEETQLALGLALLRIEKLPEEVLPENRPLILSAGEISILLHNSKYDLAFEKLKAALAAYPATPFLHYSYGKALSSLSQFSEAQVQLLEETKVSPESELPYLSLAAISLKLKRPKDALPYSQRALTLAPRSAETHYMLGRTYLELERLGEAVNELEAASKMAPSSAEVHFQLARAYAKTKQPEKAEQERAIFSRLSAELEKQRSRQGSQAYGAAHQAGDGANEGLEPPPSERR